jgi:ferredoxin-nitrite reductase
MRGEQLVEAARLADAYGSGELRLATDQNLILTGVPSERLDDLLAEPLLAEHSPRPGPFERGVVACTGSEFCRFAIVETKVRAAQWARWLDRNVAPDGNGQSDEIIRMHLSGCSASCAQPQIADIGLRGEVAHTDDAVVEAVDVGLGGSLGGDAAFIDWVEGAKPAAEAPAGLLALVERWRAERRPGEQFHQWCRRVPNADLRATLAPQETEGGAGGSRSEAVAPRLTGGPGGSRSEAVAPRLTGGPGGSRSGAQPGPQERAADKAAAGPAAGQSAVDPRSTGEDG